MTPAASQRLRLGCFVLRLESRLAAIHHHLRLHYSDLPSAEQADCDDFWMRIRAARRWIPGRAQVRVAIDQSLPLIPLPLRYAAPMMESVLNWQVAMGSDRHIALHAGVVDRGGRAVLLPGGSGSGKSTLSAALMLKGWRLLSDEFGLVRPDGRTVDSFVRPVSVKNRSIDVLQAFSPEARFGPRFEGLAKGTVAFLTPSPDSRRRPEPAEAAMIVFPIFREGAAFEARPMVASEAYLRLVKGAANYERMGETAFRALLTLVRAVPAYSLHYGALAPAMDWIDERMAAS